MEQNLLEQAHSIVAGLYSSRAIDFQEQTILTELADRNDPKIVMILTRHELGSSLESVQSELVRLAKHKHKPEQVYIPPRNVSEEMTSPLDNYLLERKKRSKPEDERGFSIGSPNLIRIEETTEQNTEEN